MSFEIEVIAFDLASCFIAEQGGAHRIELCANPQEGGTTPSAGMIKLARKATKLQLFPIIRPRGGDFLYDNTELMCMIEDIKICKEEGCDGVVIGMLKADGSIDTDACHEMIHHANGMEITFHRAFDRVKDQESALSDVIQLGCKRILTSGGFPTALEGKEQLKKLVEMAQNEITIMLGSGVKSSNIKLLRDYTGAKAFHASARTKFSSNMKYHAETMHENLEKISLDQSELRLLRKTLDGIFS
jgi:copper homeostasis protein